MHAAFVRLGALPEATQVFVGHEYTVKNLEWAAHFEPGNAAAALKLTWAQEQRSKGLPTVPSSIAEECKCNPFLRFNEPSVRLATNTQDPVQCLLAVRTGKDAWGRRK